MAGKKVAVSCVLAGALFVVAFLVLQGLFLGDGGPVVSPEPGGEGAPEASGEDAGSELPEGTTDPEGVAESGEGPAEEGAAGVVPDGPLSLEGRVTDAAGDGIPGARVLALDIRTWRAVFADIETRFQGDPLEGIRYLRDSFQEAGRSVPL